MNKDGGGTKLTDEWAKSLLSRWVMLREKLSAKLKLMSNNLKN